MCFAVTGTGVCQETSGRSKQQLDRWIKIVPTILCFAYGLTCCKLLTCGHVEHIQSKKSCVVKFHSIKCVGLLSHARLSQMITRVKSVEIVEDIIRFAPAENVNSTTSSVFSSASLCQYVALPANSDRAVTC